MVLLFAQQITPRLDYTAGVVFSEVLGIHYSITTDYKEFEQYKAAKINYSHRAIGQTLQIEPTGLIDETGIQVQNPLVGKWDEIPCLFANHSSAIPFDIFSAVFYLVTRYEEYLPFEADVHSRFEAKQSIAFNENFLRLPIVDLWCLKLAKQLGILKDCPGVQRANYRFRLTVDIDYAYWFKYKGIALTAGSMLKNMVAMKYTLIKDQMAVLLGKKQDPADTYTFLNTIQQRISRKINYFILLAPRSKYDKNISAKQKPFRDLLQKLSVESVLGIHPSYASNASFSNLKAETDGLSNIINKPVTKSRQHFLKITLPETYQRLQMAGIEEDYTMGYGEQTGFRAGIARSILYYDLTFERATSLRIFPFEIMDRTLLSYMKLNPEKSKEEFRYYTEMVQSVGGELVCIWHNNSLSDYGEWKDWKNVFEYMINING